MPNAAPHDPAGSVPSVPSIVDPEADILLVHQQNLAQTAMDQLVDRLSQRLVGYFCSPVSVRSVGIRQGGQIEFTPDDIVGCAVELELDPVPGCALLHLDRNFASAALGSLLGAPEDADEMPRETFSEVDLHILEGLIGVIAEELKAAWKPLFGVAFRPGVPILKVPLSGAASHGAVEFRGQITLRKTSGLIRIVIPSLLVRLAAERACEPASVAVQSSEDALASSLECASLRLDAVMPGGDIRLKDLLLLKPGAILQLPIQAGIAMQCRVNGVAKFTGDLVANGALLGFQVRDLLIEDEAV